MTSDEWQRVRQAFEIVLRAGSSERLALLDDVCGGHPAIRAEVESLLASHERAGQFIEPPDQVAPATALGRGAAPEPPHEWIGRDVGEYAILGVLGAGGMGTVFEAQQAQPRRRVALKVMHAGGPTDRHVQRLFERETRALARLGHPGIAAIYAAGHTPEGRYYFAMELVHGLPPHEYARQHDLTLAQRLELFIPVCEAIAYAHQRGVIHRDVKPGNILVTAQAQPKVLDFGLARITDADVSLTTVLVDAARVQGTLAYMSPEQTYGKPEDIDLRSDIYSLGVVLYELLTGALPYDVRGVPLPLAVRAIRDEMPRRPGCGGPSTRRIRGDVETILFKALEKSPGQRYQSVPELVDDIRRYLTGRPILARPHSAAYHIRKLAARHKVASLGLGLLLLLTLGFATTVTVLYQRALGAETAAVNREHASAQLSDFLLNLVDRLDARSGERVGTIEFWRTTDMDKRPETVRALVLSRYSDALGLLNRSGGGLHLPEAQRVCNTGWLLTAAGEIRRAQDVFLRLVDVMSRSPERFGDNLVYALTGCRMTFLIDGAFEDAANASGRAYQLRRALLAPGDRDLRLSSLCHGYDLLHCGLIQEAMPLLEEALPLAQSAGAESTDAAGAWLLWGAALALQGRYAEAEPHLRRAVAVNLLEERPTPDGTNAKLWLCGCLLRMGAEPEAERLLSELQATARQQGCDAIVLNAHSLGVLGLREIVRFLVERGDDERALTLFGTHMGLIRVFRQFDWRHTPIRLPGLVELLRRRRVELLASQERGERFCGTGAEFLDLWCTAQLLRWSDAAGALQLLEAVAQRAAAAPTLVGGRLAAPWRWKAEVMLQMQRFFEAEELSRRAYEVALQTNGPEDCETAHDALAYAIALIIAGKPAEAEALLRLALPLSTIAGLDGFSTSYCYAWLGASRLLQGHPAEAEPLLRAARERCARWTREQAEPLALIDKWLCACLYREGKLAEAEALFEQLSGRRDHMGAPQIAISGPVHVLALREIMRHFVVAGEPARAAELIGDNAALAATFTRLNETAGRLNVPGLAARLATVQAAELAQLEAPGEHLDLAGRVNSRAAAIQRLGDFASALQAFQTVVPHLSGPNDSGCPRCGAQWGAAGALRWLNQFEESAQLMPEVYEGLRQQQFGRTRADTSAAGREYATALLLVGKAAEAERILHEILPDELSLVFPESAYAALALERLGAALALQARFREAQPLFRRVRDQRMTIWPEDNGQVELATLWLIVCQFRNGERAAAEESLARLEQQTTARGRKSIVHANPINVLAFRALLHYLVENGEFERATRFVGADPRVQTILSELNQRLGDISLELP